MFVVFFSNWKQHHDISTYRKLNLGIEFVLYSQHVQAKNLLDNIDHGFVLYFTDKF